MFKDDIPNRSGLTTYFLVNSYIHFIIIILYGHIREARYNSSLFDGSPDCLKESERILKNEEGVLRLVYIYISTF